MIAGSSSLEDASSEYEVLPARICTLNIRVSEMLLYGHTEAPERDRRDTPGELREICV